MCFIDLKGKRRSVDNRLVVKTVEFVDFSSITEILSENALSPLAEERDLLADVAAHYPQSRTYIEPYLKRLDADLSRFRAGARKLKGRWFSAEEYKALLASEAAARAAGVRRLEDERQAAEQKAAEERAIAARHTQDEAAEAKRKQDLQGAVDLRRSTDDRVDSAGATHTGGRSHLVNTVPEYKARVQLLWAEVSRDPAATQTLTSWREVKEFPVRLSDNIHALAETARSFRRAIGYEVAVTQCETENTKVDVLLATDTAIQALKKGDAAAAIQAANGIGSSSSADPRRDPLRSTLSSIRELSSRLEAEVGKHLDNATRLAAEGHPSDAVKECNIAYQVLPDPKIQKRIKEIQKDSLGL